MTTAYELIANGVAEGTEEDRLTDVALKIQSQGVHYCVVCEKITRRFVGLVRLGEVATRSNAGQRILADLISPVRPLTVRPNESAAKVGELFTRFKISEAVVLDSQGTYVGLITAWSMLVWSEQARHRTDEMLAAALAQLEGASLARKNLIDGLSHELRTPLTPVLLLASQAAANPSVPEELRRNFEEIAELVTHEAKLIDELLDQKNIQRGALVLDKKTVSIDTVLQRVIADATLKIGAKAIDFIYSPAAEKPQVNGDDVRLQQAFSNLLDNAVKFTPAGGKLRLTAAVQPDAQTVTVTLSDTGIGFTPGESERAFTPLARGDEADPLAARPFPGLGLGLSIAQAIIELHGGSIEVISRGRNLGAVVSVILLTDAKAAES